MAARPSITASDSGDDLFPICAFGRGACGLKDAETRRVFIGGDVELAVQHFTVIEKVSAAGDALEAALRRGWSRSLLRKDL